MDLLSNYVCSLKNASKANSEMMEIQASKLLLAVSNVLKNEGVIENFRVVRKSNNRLFLQAKPKFKKYDQPVLRDFMRVSKPGLRIYWSCNELKKKKMLQEGNFVLSTPHGVMTDKDAINKGIGGEVLCRVIKQ